MLTSVILVHVYTVYTYSLEAKAVGLASRKYERLPIIFGGI